MTNQTQIDDNRKGGVSSFTDQRTGKRRWMIKLPVINPDGTKGYRYIRRFDRKRDADAAFDEMRRKADKGQDIFASAVRFEAYANAFAEEAVKDGRWRASTALRNRGLLNNFILPVLGGIEVRAIKPVHVRAVLSNMREGYCSASSIAQARACVSGILKQAVVDELLVMNPARVVDKPKSKKPEREKVVPTDEQVLALLRAAQGSVWEIPLLLSATTGCRRSEIVGLTWSAVDLDAGAIEIRQGVHYDHVTSGENGRRQRQLVPLPPKSKESHRYRELAPFVVERLRRHRADQRERRFRAGGAWQHGDYVLDRGDGRPLDPGAFSQQFKRLGRQVGMDPLTTLRNLRDGYLTGLADDGFHPKVVAAVAGHHDPGFTYARYIAPRKAAMNAVAEATERRYGAS